MEKLIINNHGRLDVEPIWRNGSVRIVARDENDLVVVQLNQKNVVLLRNYLSQVLGDKEVPDAPGLDKGQWTERYVIALMATKFLTPEEANTLAEDAWERWTEFVNTPL